MRAIYTGPRDLLLHEMGLEVRAREAVEAPLAIDDDVTLERLHRFVEVGVPRALRGVLPF